MQDTTIQHSIIHSMTSQSNTIPDRTKQYKTRHGNLQYEKLSDNVRQGKKIQYKTIQYNKTQNTKNNTRLGNTRQSTTLQDNTIQHNTH